MEQLKTIDDIIREVRSVEPTDQLIALNKRYEKLSEIYDKYDALIDELDQLEEMQSDVAKLEKLRDAVYKKMRSVWDEANNLFLFQRMAKAAMMQKALK